MYNTYKIYHKCQWFWLDLILLWVYHKFMSSHIIDLLFTPTVLVSITWGNAMVAAVAVIYE